METCVPYLRHAGYESRALCQPVSSQLTIIPSVWHTAGAQHITPFYRETETGDKTRCPHSSEMGTRTCVPGSSRVHSPSSPLYAAPTLSILPGPPHYLPSTQPRIKEPGVQVES